MQSFYPETFEREMGCTEAEWLMWLPAAMGEAPWQRDGHGLQARVQGGGLHVQWRTGEPRRIALISMPRLHVSFNFKGLNDEARYTFMKRFDLFMQRGGG